ncbi:hypothetical protein VOLCADRAFT_93779 [Volvox carteri f. nagariensis]|uniref:Uncharacterized protein n=1 Tax=Volvox carteri f. nagariensis TaxID=3068 RepID=D8U313_VOLCA|nr:uncharacterized protein VOLCADRAFT_93779 [Volvox carteri f. nagariensis]EFJ45995.1 hypothetical protein VOLCADRAFT_93779 [Volvox carteri f. nagariensis]|eukprot:XP_002953073.1 hypothetical protein VOLCADRAFT_93779 [Volvox carteri f. nagariensis]
MWLCTKGAQARAYGAPNPARHPVTPENLPGRAPYASPAVTAFGVKHPELPLKTLDALRRACIEDEDIVENISDVIRSELDIAGREGALQLLAELKLPPIDCKRVLDSLLSATPSNTSNKSNKSKSRISDTTESSAVKVPACVPEAFADVFKPMNSQSDASKFNVLVATKVIKAGILWTDISEGLAPRNDTPATTPIHIKTIITHWMTVLCHIKTIGKGNLLSLKRNSTARKEGSSQRAMRACSTREVIQLKEQGTWEEPTDDMRQKADQEAREKALAILGRIKQKAGFVDKKKNDTEQGGDAAAAEAPAGAEEVAPVQVPRQQEQQNPANPPTSDEGDGTAAEMGLDSRVPVVETSD